MKSHKEAIDEISYSMWARGQICILIKNKSCVVCKTDIWICEPVNELTRRKFQCTLLFLLIFRDKCD